MSHQKRIIDAMWHNPRRYALLAGAGVSRSAKVPLADEIVAMIATEKVRRHERRSPQSQDEFDAWRASQDPPFATYQDALRHLGEHVADSADFIRKLVADTSPSKGHKCLAELVATGWFQHIFTTNFDRLIEQSLMLKGIDPCILSKAVRQQLRQKLREKVFGKESPASVVEPLVEPFKVLSDAVGEEKALQEFKKIQDDPDRLSALSGEGWNHVVMEQLCQAIHGLENQLRQMQSALRDVEEPPKWFEKWMPFLRRRKPQKARDAIAR